MSDSTIDDAIRLLEIGKGNSDRLKQIIDSFETRSLITLQDRKYVEALVQQYLTPRHRITIKKIEPIKKQPSTFPKTLKSTKPDFNFKNNITESDVNQNLEKPNLKINTKKCPECGNENSDKNNFCNKCGKRLTPSQNETKSTGLTSLQTQTSDQSKKETAFQKYEREYLERQSGKKVTSDGSEHVEYIEAKIPSSSKKHTKKLVGIAIGIIAVIIIGGGVALMADDNTLPVKTESVERVTCDNKPLLVSTTKIPGFPNPEKDLQYYLDRYNNEPNYKDWFDRNFPDQTIKQVVC